MSVYLRPPQASDSQEFTAKARASVAFHHPWVSPATTESTYLAYLQRVGGERHAPFLICRRRDDAIVGVANLNEITAGALRSAYVGYWGFDGFAGRGYMTMGVALLIEHAFGVRGLHRLEINIQPGNVRSIALAARLGARKEGFSEKYLFVDGAWRDHERWAMLVEDWRERGGAAMILASIQQAEQARV